MLNLHVNELSVTYGRRQILNQLSASFPGGDMTAVIGKNGAGKSTFIRAIAGQVKHTGNVRLSDHLQNEYPRTDIAYLPQMNTSDTNLTVFEFVLLGLVHQLGWRVTNEQTATVTNVLRELNLSELSRRPFRELSGGQKQLVAMAQSFAAKPKVLLLDEPTSALDLRHQLIVMDLAAQYTRQTGAVTLFVGHDLTLAARYSDRMILIDEGRVKAYDEPEKVLRPEWLEEVYDVQVSVEKTALGHVNVVPVQPLFIEKTE